MSTMATAIPFREATRADLPRLAELFERFRAESPYAQCGVAAPEVSTALIEHLIVSDDGLVMVLDIIDRLVGMMGVLVTDHPMSHARIASELFWYVEPEHRGHGVWLLRRAERWAVERGADFLLMVSLAHSSAVSQLYERLGYAQGETSWYKSLGWFDRHQPRAKTYTHAPHGIVIHDDVLPDPLAYRAMALQQRFQAVHDGAVTFQRMAPCANPAVPLWIVQHYPQLTPTLTFFRQGELDQEEPHYIHTDASMGEWTGLLYLNPEPPVDDGTAFWKHVPTGKVQSLLITKEEASTWFDGSQWEQWRTVQARFNRLVLFPASLYHSRLLFGNYGHGETARLLQVAFGTGRLS